MLVCNLLVCVCGHVGVLKYEFHTHTHIRTLWNAKKRVNTSKLKAARKKKDTNRDTSRANKQADKNENEIENGIHKSNAANMSY